MKAADASVTTPAPGARTGAAAGAAELHPAAAIMVATSIADARMCWFLNFTSGNGGLICDRESTPRAPAAEVERAATDHDQASARVTGSRCASTHGSCV